MNTYIELPIREYISEVHKRGLEGFKLFLNGESGGATTKARYDLYKSNGEMISFSTWRQFIAVVYEFGQQREGINFNKTWESFAEKHPYDVDRVVIVEAYIDEHLKENTYNLGHIKSQSKKLSALAFKRWLNEYLSQFEWIDYQVDESDGVKKILTELEEYELA